MIPRLAASEVICAKRSPPTELAHRVARADGQQLDRQPRRRHEYPESAAGQDLTTRERLHRELVRKRHGHDPQPRAAEEAEPGGSHGVIPWAAPGARPGRPAVIDGRRVAKSPAAALRR